MQRYHIHNATHLIEFPATFMGLMEAKAFRLSNPGFKWKRIKSVLQLQPSTVPIGVLMERT